MHSNTRAPNRFRIFSAPFFYPILVITVAWLTFAVRPSTAQDLNRIRDQLKKPIPQSAPKVVDWFLDPYVAAASSDASLHKVLSLNTDRILAVGDRGLVLLSQDAGRSWQQPSTGTSLNLYGSAAADEMNIWVVGGKIQPQSEMSIGVVLHSQDSGRTWKAIAGGNIPRLTGIAVVGDGSLIAWGDYSPSLGSSLFESRDGGATWQGMPSQLGHIQAAARDAAGRFLAVDRAGRASNIPHSANELPDQIAEPTRPVQGAEFIAGKWMVFGDHGTLAASSDGSLWTDVPLPLSPRARAVFSFRSCTQVGDQVWLAGYPGSVMLHSADRGATWKTVATPGNWPIQSLTFADSDRGWAVTEGGSIWATRDGGATWFAQRLVARRLGLLAIAGTYENIPWQALAESVAEAQQTTAVKVLHRQRLEESASLLPEMHLAVESAGAQIGLVAAITDSAYPIPDRRLQGTSSVRDYYRTQSISDRKLSPSLPDDLVVALRCYRPSVVLTDNPNPTGPIAGAVLNAVSTAVDFASQSTGELKWMDDELKLSPWKTSKLVIRTDDKGAQFKLTRDQLLGTPGLSIADILTPTYGLIGSSDDACPLRIMQSTYQNAATNASIFATGERSDDSRRRIDFKGIGTLQLVLGRTSRETGWRKLAEQNVVTQSESAAWLKQLQFLIDSTPTYECGPALNRCAKTLILNGQWDRASTVLLKATERAPVGDSSRWAALQWLRIAPSDERLAWQELIRSSTDVSGRSPVGPTSDADSGKLAGNTSPWTATPFDQRPPSMTKHSATGVITASGQSNSGALPSTVQSASATSADRDRNTATVSTEGVTESSSIQFMASELRSARIAALDQAASSFSQLTAADSALAARPDLLMAHHARRRAQAELLKLPLPDPSGLHNISRSGQIIGWKQVADQELILTAGQVSSLKLKTMCSRTEAPPQLDGLADDECWQHAEPIRLEGSVGGNTSSATQVRFAFDDQFLYIHANCPATRQIETPKTPRTYDMRLEGTDHLLFQLDTDRDYTSACELGINRFGHTSDRCCNESAWNPKWYVAVGGTETTWSAELAVRLSDLTCQESVGGRAWAVSVHRFQPDGATENWSHLRVSTPYLHGAGLLLFEHD